jgi:hypothetical protein
LFLIYIAINCITLMFRMYAFLRLNFFFLVSKEYLTCNSHPKSIVEDDTIMAKYNLHRKEYECYNKNEYSYGDYPKLPLKGVDLQDPYYPYDNLEHRRNFNEPVNILII